MPTPHDALFKLTFANPEHAAPMLRTALPEELSSRVDWSSLQSIPISFVDEELTDHYADLLFAARMDGRDALRASTVGSG